MPSRAKPAGRIHKHLKLQHHQHTGRVLHRRHTSYRGLALLFVIAGAFMLGLNYMARVTADSITVNTNGNLLHVYATVPAPIPQTASVITEPVSGQISKSVQIVRGVCPHTDPHVIVAIYMDGVDQGSAACDDADTFSVPILVPLGPHTLIARTFTITGDTGPDSQPVYINFALLDKPAPNVGSNKQPDLPPQAISIEESTPFIVFGPGADAVWTGHISGGTPPFTITVDWGDGHKDTYSTAGDVNYHHHYKLMQSYDVTITIRDSHGRTMTQHYAAVTPFRHAAPNPILSTGNGTLSGPQAFELYLGYLGMLGIFFILWKRRHHEFAFAPVYARPRPFLQRYNRAYGVNTKRRKTIAKKR